MANDYRFIGSAPKGTASARKVMLATPVGRDPCCAYTVALAATVHSLASFGIEVQVHLHQGNCHVDDARNTMIRDFLETDCTDLFFLDADLGWRPYSVKRMLDAPGDIVAGVYCHRSPGETYPFHPGEGVRESNEHGLFEMHKVPTGFMRIRRNVLQTLHENEREKGRTWWWGQEERATKLPLARIVERGFVSELGLKGLGGSDSDYHSGDYVLCLKARAAGFKVYVDIDHWFEHVGEQAYQGHLGNHLRKQQGVDHPQFAAAIDAVKQGSVTPDTFNIINALSPNPRSALPGRGLAECYKMALTTEGDILECGSGLSTVVMAAALAGTPHRVCALEHDLFWFRVTGQWLARYGLLDHVTLLYAPLMPYDIGDWYGLDPEEIPERFDGVLIDGPTRTDAKRDGLFYHLGDRVAGARIWIIDDCGDPLQDAMVKEHAGDRVVDYFTAISGGMSGAVPHKIAIARRHPQPQLIAAE